MFIKSMLLLSLLNPFSSGEQLPSIESQLYKADDVLHVESCFAHERATYDGFVSYSVNEFKASGGKAFSSLTNEIFKERFKAGFYEKFKRNIDCYLIQYQSEGAIVDGYLVAEKDNNEVLPLVIHNRGGNGEYGKSTILSMLSHMPLLKEGAIVMGSQYRAKDEFGGADVKDVHALIEIGKSLASVKKDDINMIGVSRGGMMSYLVAKQRDDIKKLVIQAGMSDLALSMRERPGFKAVYEARIPNYSESPNVALHARSAINWVDEINERVEILLLHGDADKRVDVKNASNMASKLASLNRKHKLVIYPGGGHSLKKEKRKVNKEISNWLF